MITIIETQDGSHSLYREDLDETYHSMHGALTESLHVFIRNGLKHWVDSHPNRKEVSVLEIGFGTGLNAALSQQFSQSVTTTINYLTLEPFPLDSFLVGMLNYFDEDEQGKNDFFELHDAQWGKAHVWGNFVFQKMKEKIESFDADRLFDVVYFDAFAPEKQPEMWDLGLIKKVSSVMNGSGVLVTYCAKGEFKRNLKLAGFEVFTLPGPEGGKREMVRAVKIDNT
jgi:tRNA U34 5-methylaminomethyl-2-thiouridine-forming methyltransferase MnmC